MAYPKNRKTNNKYIISDNEIKEIIKLYLSGSTIREICKIYKSSITRISNILKNNNIKVLKAWEIRLAELDVLSIVNSYKEGLTISKVMKKYKISFPVLKRILSLNNIEIRSSGYYESERAKFPIELQKEIVEKYTIDKLSMGKLSEIYSCDFDKIKRTLIDNNITIISDYKLQMAKLTEEEENKAVEMYKSGRTFREISKIFDTNFTILKRVFDSKGIKSRTHLQIFSKKFGFIGNYKDFLFRSLMELSFIIDNENLHKIVSAEYLKIPYFYNGKKRKYLPDFLLDDIKLIEIKPNSYLNQEVTKQKCIAAHTFCKKNGLEFSIIEWSISKDKIRDLIINGEVQILNKSKENINKYFNIKL